MPSSLEELERKTRALGVGEGRSRGGGWGGGSGGGGWGGGGGYGGGGRSSERLVDARPSKPAPTLATSAPAR